MKRMLMAAVALICMTVNVAAQQPNSLKQKAEKMAKAADADPQNWRKHIDAGTLFLSINDLEQCEKYTQRALEIAEKMEVKKDTILPKSLGAMAVLYLQKQDYEKMLYFQDMAIRAYIDEFGYQNKLIPPVIAQMGVLKNLITLRGVYPYGDVECIRSLREANILNDQLPEGERATGLEETETVNAIAHEMLLMEHQRAMKDKVWMWTNPTDGKTYTILAFDDWTLEQPEGFFSTMWRIAQGEKEAEEMKHGLIMMDEQGKVRELIHGEFTFNVFCNVSNGNFSLDKNSNIRLVSVTPERRRQMIDALNGRRQQIMDDFKKNVEEKKLALPTKISPGALNINKSVNNKGYIFRFGKAK